MNDVYLKLYLLNLIAETEEAKKYYQNILSNIMSPLVGSDMVSFIDEVSFAYYMQNNSSSGYNRKIYKLAKKSPYIRVGVIDVKSVLKFVGINQEKTYIFNGEKYIVNLSNSKLRTFKKQGCRCVECGVEGMFFALEKMKNDPSEKAFHFNLYTLNSDGEEVQMTQDHILPKSKGGTKHLFNLQPMCQVCNVKKGNIT